MYPWIAALLPFPVQVRLIALFDVAVAARFEGAVVALSTADHAESGLPSALIL